MPVVRGGEKAGGLGCSEAGAEPRIACGVCVRCGLWLDGQLENKGAGRRGFASHMPLLDEALAFPAGLFGGCNAAPRLIWSHLSEEGMPMPLDRKQGGTF